MTLSVILLTSNYLLYNFICAFDELVFRIFGVRFHHYLASAKFTFEGKLENIGRKKLADFLFECAEAHSFCDECATGKTPDVKRYLKLRPWNAIWIFEIIGRFCWIALHFAVNVEVFLVKERAWLDRSLSGWSSCLREQLWVCSYLLIAVALKITPRTSLDEAILILI